MLILAILFTLVLVAAFAVVPARLGRRKPTRADGCCALLPAVLVWLWAACIWSKPGLTIGFDAFRCLGITAMVRRGFAMPRGANGPRRHCCW